MPIRRRPLLRAAAIGGGAYMAGRNRERRAESASGQGTAEPSPAPATAPATAPPSQAAPAGVGSPAASSMADQPESMADQLDRLTGLHRQGELTDTEFATAKARLLGT